MAIDKNEYINKVKTNLYANKNFTVFYYDFTSNNKRHRGIIDLSSKVGWNKKDKVSYAEAELISIKNTKKDLEINDNIILDKLMMNHFKHLDDTSWTKTKVSHYERYVSPYIGKKKVIDIRQMHIKEAMKKQEDLGIAPRTIKQTIETLNPAFKEAIANRLIALNPCDGITIKIPKSKKLVTNATDRLKEVYLAIVETYKNDPFYQAFFLFALQGRRKGEIINLKWEDVSFQNDYYIIRDTKNGETQKMYLPNNIRELLSIFYDENQTYVFTSKVTGSKLAKIENQVKKLKEILGDNFGIHYLRNVISSAMGEMGLEAIYQSGALGHNDLTTINKYSSLNYLKGSKMASNVISDIVK